MLKNYLEATIGKKSAGRLTDIIKDRVARLAGTKVYATKIMDHFIKDQGGSTYGIFMMLADNKRAFRLNWKTANASASVDSVDIWTSQTLNPHWTVDAKGLNVVELVRAIDEALGLKKKQVAEAHETEGHKFKRIGNSRKFAVTGPSGDAEIAFGGTMDDMREKIDSMGAKAFIDKYRTKGTKTATTQASNSLITQASGEKPADMRNTEFDKMFESNLTEAEIFGLLERGIENVKSGKSKTLMILGDPGIGKTYSVATRLAGQNADTFKGGITSAAALYKLLYINNEKGKILVFDDLDTLFDDRECVNMLKGALESSNDAEVSYISNNTVHPIYYRVLKGELDSTDPKVVEQLNKLKIDIEGMSEKRLENMQARAQDPYASAAILPNKFAFHSKVIFISNKYMNDIPEAILSRAGTKIEINLTLDEIVKRIGKLLPKLEIPVEAGTTPISMKEKQAAHDYLTKVLVPYGKIPKVDFRTFFDLCRLASSGSPTELWHRWASVSLREAYGTRFLSGKKHKR